MFTIASTTDEPLAMLLIDHAGADLIIHSQDSHQFRVPKTYLVDNSPVLSKLIERTLDSPMAEDDKVPLPLLRLPERGIVLHNIFTYILPVPPAVPSAPEETLELLSVAQKYQMCGVLAYIRDRIAQFNPLPTDLEPALRIYSLAQTYGLRPEALQAARIIRNYPMTIEAFDNMFNVMPCIRLYQLWKFHEESRLVLASDLKEFSASRAGGIMRNVYCTDPYRPRDLLPDWLCKYIESIGKSPGLFDLVEFSLAMASGSHHGKGGESCSCASIPSQTIRDFWVALESIIKGSFKKAEFTLSLEQERKDPQAKINSITSPVEPFDIPNADLMIRSSDSVDFRVNKSVLAMASPVFRDMLSLPQTDSESVDGIPVVQLDEDSELLNTLISILYPVSTVVPKSYEKVLHLLAACQKCDMDLVQSYIRTEVGRGEFPAPKGAEAFTAYAIASDKGLILEMESAARQTLDLPLTYEIFGLGLEGWALRNLANFRRRCRDSLIVRLHAFLSDNEFGPSGIWVHRCGYPSTCGPPSLPKWLHRLPSQSVNDLKLQMFTHPLDLHSKIRDEYLKALSARGYHLECCLKLHAQGGFAYCAKLENELTLARNKVRGDCDPRSSLTYPSPRNR